ncbi:MAG: ATP synthase F0 subunit C [Chitinispirillaceae bacterium]|nr:ATP synthase F0 subunit C [Chitinispirillaceae bacterium]
MDSTTLLVNSAPRLAEYLGVALGVALIVIGSSIGIGLIGSKALDSIARQPDMKGEIRTNMILAAAFIEGVAFFGAVICLLILFTK